METKTFINAEAIYGELVGIAVSEISLLNFVSEIESLLSIFMKGKSAKIYLVDQMVESDEVVNTTDCKKLIGYIQSIKKLYKHLHFDKTVTNEFLDKLKVLQMSSDFISRISTSDIPEELKNKYGMLRSNYDLNCSLDKINLAIKYQEINQLDTHVSKQYNEFDQRINKFKFLFWSSILMFSGTLVLTITNLLK